jgi:translation elongation factor EF-1alpha
MKFARYAHILEEEKKTGSSIESCIMNLKTDEFDCTFLDTPGNPDHIANTIRAITMADVAIIVIDCTEDALAVGLAKGPGGIKK